VTLPCGEQTTLASIFDEPAENAGAPSALRAMARAVIYSSCSIQAFVCRSLPPDVPVRGQHFDSIFSQLIGSFWKRPTPVSRAAHHAG